ncbi:MAG: bifunctional folylpolyglutamate synthase/dihydrofolate synthase [Bacteroidetes bacterium]|nr:bifunctional folylpolyglutamate synthase/dihydrofolate synthase [Bacteroidota bacterium]
MTQYQQILNYIFNQLPVFQRIGPAAYKTDITNTIAICNLLQNPQHNFRSIHIAGTNGKGSVSHFTASILQEAGLKVGLYTSPHLRDFRERIRINGKKIPKAYICNFVNTYQKDFDAIRPSFFEMTVGMAFHYFSEEKVDVAVLETGLGGRLDSTNIVVPVLAVITNIGYDHMQFLGDTLEKIAGEKAGIIKPGKPVVIGERQDETQHVFIRKAETMGSLLVFAGDHYATDHIRYLDYSNPLLQMDITRNGQSFISSLKSPLTGQYQLKNIRTALQVAECLNNTGFDISKDQIRKGIYHVIKNTGIAGRWQILCKDPLTICDVGHNKEGIIEVLKQIDITPHQQLHFVFGMVADKNINEILSLLPKDARYYFCKANIPRGLDQHVLAEQAKSFHLAGGAYPSVTDAVHDAQKNALKDDMVFIGGSTFVVAEAI